ncbi:hypothetical protein M438DRAFT_151155 [Aureobasidium pullulans EXF-150]|uniref:Uncharacterized protein n=1 Tax=Aureobasidium pullulans EXF-150 TaxID=1043002 RepID=A0A074X1R1_AURPU|nr:uncharacterized protein M438DRAFT_151155 [Aureobasidium pullulans EXF-150]KEQ79343.1 hypothetical protein M438DRAFT_151155 [Aureobasidium pullulans EXF-150]
MSGIDVLKQVCTARDLYCNHSAYRGRKEAWHLHFLHLARLQLFFDNNHHIQETKTAFTIQHQSTIMLPFIINTTNMPLLLSRAARTIRVRSTIVPMTTRSRTPVPLPTIRHHPLSTRPPSPLAKAIERNSRMLYRMLQMQKRNHKENVDYLKDLIKLKRQRKFWA